jgi:hypothetical protein
MGKCKRLLTMVLAAVLCCTMLPVTAFAGGGPEDGSDKVLEYWSQGSTPPQDVEQGQPPAEPSAQPSPQPGEPLAQGSEFSTRDLLYDKDTHKQFITVEGRDGNIFYIVIDYDAPVNEKEEQYQTYFLNKVDEADLAALIEQGEPVACSCTDKCYAGAINTACPLCAVNMTECVGKEPEPSAPVESEQPDADPEPVKKADSNGLLLVVLAVALAGGGAAYFLKFKKKKPDTKGDADLDDYDYGDEDEYSDAEDEPEDGEDE